MKKYDTVRISDGSGGHIEVGAGDDGVSIGCSDGVEWGGVALDSQRVFALIELLRESEELLRVK